MGNFDAIIMHLQYYKAFSAIPFENDWIIQIDKTNELLHLFPVSCTPSWRCHQWASHGRASQSQLWAQSTGESGFSLKEGKPAIVLWDQGTEEGWFTIIHSDHGIKMNLTLFVISFASLPREMFLYYLKSVVNHSSVIDQGFTGKWDSRYQQHNRGTQQQLVFSTIAMEETHLSSVFWNYLPLVSSSKHIWE